MKIVIVGSVERHSCFYALLEEVRPCPKVVSLQVPGEHMPFYRNCKKKEGVTI